MTKVFTRTPVNRRVVGKATKSLAATVSTAAALVSVVTFARAYGLIGAPASHLTVGDLGATWVGVTPGVDTARSIGDTIQLAATIKDRNGSALMGASLVWTTENPEVAAVMSDGSVIARAPGTTTIVATVGSLIARSRITVRPKVASVRIAGDSAIVLRDGGRLPISARPLDARGYVIPGRRVEWRTADSAIAYVDSLGYSVARRPGHTTFRASLEGIGTEASITVIAVPAVMSLLTGANQRAPVNSALPLPVAVRVLTRHGTAIGGIPVRFRPADGEGSAEPSATTTDSDGRARTEWTLGEMPGRARLLALVDGLDSALFVEAEAEPVAANTRISTLNDGQRAHIGERLPLPVVVRLADSTGRPLEDVPVSWTVLDGGEVSGTANRTDSLGEARANWKLAAKTGTQRLRARIGVGRSLPPVTLMATALAGSAASATLVSGDAQRGPVGSPLPNPVAVRVSDRAGNPVRGVPVHFTPAKGTMSESVVGTDSLGIARSVWTTARQPGEHRLSVRIEGLSGPLSATAVARSGSAANVSTTPAAAAGISGRTLDAPVVATVTDMYGNAVPNAAVSFSVRSGSVSPMRAVTDAQGRVRTHWTLGLKAAEQTLTIQVRDADVRTTLTADVSAAPSRTPVLKKATVSPRRGVKKPA